MKIGKFENLDPQIRQVLRGASLSLVLRTVGAVAGFSFTLLIARLFGPQGSGLYAMVFVTAVIFSVIGLLGCDLSVVKYVSVAHAKGSRREVTQYISSAFAITIVSAGMLMIAGYAARNVLVLKIFKEPELFVPLSVMLATIVPLTIVKLSAACLNGLGRYASAQIADGVLLPVLAVGAMFILPFAGIERAAVAYLAGVTIAAIFGVWMIVQSIGTAFLNLFECNRKRDLLKVGGPALGIVLSNYLTEWSSIFILAYFSSTTEVGFFRIGWQLMLLLTIFGMVINAIVTPISSALYYNNEFDKLARLYRWTVGLLAGAALPIAIVFILASRPVLLVFGLEFVEGGLALSILAVGWYFYVSFGISGKILLMTGHERKCFANSAVSALVVVTLNFLLIPEYGAVGAAIAVATSLLLQVTVTTYMVRRFVGLRLAPWAASE